MEQQPASRSSDTHAELWSDDDHGFDDELHHGLPCTEQGHVLLDKVAAPGQAYLAPAAAPHDPRATQAVEGPWPRDIVQMAMLKLYHPQQDKRAEGVNFLAERTAAPPAGRHTSKQELKKAGGARVAAFGHVTQLIMLLESDDKQVPGLLPMQNSCTKATATATPSSTRVTCQDCPAASPTICIDHKLVSGHLAVANCVAIANQVCAGVVLHAPVTGVLVC
jgi:hypothetical protein